MTPKQTANQIYDQYWTAVNDGPVSKDDPLPDFRPLIEQAITAAIEEEREACAKVCDNAQEKCERVGNLTFSHIYKGIAKAIRARSSK